MTLANEAAYLYVYSKELAALNKCLNRWTRKVQKHRLKHEKTTDERKKQKHRLKHSIATNKIKELMKKHNTLLTKLKHHQIAFAHAIQKEHMIKNR